MSLSKKVSKSIEEFEKKDYGESLYQIVSAIDATAQAEYDGHGRSIYKRFVHDNLKLITMVGWDIGILNIHLDYKLPPHVQPSTPEGAYSIQDIIYYAVRCSLAHKGSLPADLEFHDGASLDMSQKGKLRLNAGLIIGLIIAVVTSPENEGADKIGNNYNLNIAPGFPIPIDKLWGRRAELTWLLEVLPRAPSVTPAPTEQQSVTPRGDGTTTSPS